MENALTGIGVSETAALIAEASDIVLLIDPDGVIVDYADSGDLIVGRIPESPLCRRWTELVTVESRPKVEEILESARIGAAQRWRQINLFENSSSDIPVSFKAICLSDKGTTLAFGRDMSPIAANQQRLVDAQLALERESARFRHAETRYRILFRNSAEAVLVLDDDTESVVEANDSAHALLGKVGQSLVAKSLADAFDGFDPNLVRVLLAKARSAAHRDVTDALHYAESGTLLATARFVRQEPASFIIVRIAASGADGAIGQVARSDIADRLIDALPDAILLTDERGRVIRANSEFQLLAQLSSEEQVRGHSISRWLGRSGTDANVLLSNLQKHGRLQNFGTTITGEMGAEARVEISSAAVRESNGTSLAFVIRNVDQRLFPALKVDDMPEPRDKLVELIGQLTLKQIVQQTTDEIERLCMEAALMLTGNNRAAAAELLGLSRQSFYLKLRRHGFGDK